MEKTIIKDLMTKYGVDTSDEVVSTYINLINLGFNNTWLRNMCIIKQFDEAYKTEQKIMSIYIDISLDNQDLSIDSIRKIIRERQLYEI
jgi:hypothetical protein